MTSRQQQLIRDSFDAIRYAAVPFTKMFYGRLFSIDPSIRPMFKIDIDEQSKKLVAMLDAIIQGMESFDALRPRLRQLGKDHVAFGVKREHYKTLSTALLWTLGQALEQQFDAETRRAWSTLLDAIRAEMLLGAEQQ